MYHSNVRLNGGFSFSWFSNASALGKLDLSRCIYAWFISFTTVGFGGYIPFDSIIPRDDGLLAAMFHLFATFPAIFGLCLVASVIDALFRVFEVDGINKESPYGKEHFQVRTNASLEDINIDDEIENLNIPSSKRSHSI